MTPEELLYSKSHEWVRVDADESGAKVATVGITAFAVEALSDLVFIDFKYHQGEQVRAEEPLAEVESVKAVSDIYSPVDGEVVEVNNDLADNLDKVSQDPYGAGWMVKIKIADEAGLGKLLDREAYQKQCAEEGD